MTVHKPDGTGSQSAGFTRVDLLAILVTVVFLALWQWPVVGHNRSVAHHTQCRDNFRRLMVAWRAYSDDQVGGLLPVSYEIGGAGKRWVHGTMNFDSTNPVNWDERYLTNAHYAVLAPYLDSARSYRCPDDSSTVRVAGVVRPRLRSVSLNYWMGTLTDMPGPSVGLYRAMQKLDDIAQPARTLALIEHRPDSNDDGSFWIYPTTNPASLRFYDLPAMAHDGGMNGGFPDGHVEHWIWQDPRTMPPLVPGSLISDQYVSPNNPDLLRLVAAATYRK